MHDLTIGLIVAWLTAGVGGPGLVYFSLRRAGTAPPRPAPPADRPPPRPAPVRPARLSPHPYASGPFAAWTTVWLEQIEPGAIAHGMRSCGVTTRCGFLVEFDGIPLGELMYAGAAVDELDVRWCVVCSDASSQQPATEVLPRRTPRWLP